MIRQGVLIIFFSIFVDQFSKFWIKKLVVEGPVVVSDNLNLVMFYNTGISFSMLRLEEPWGPWFLSGLSLCIVSLLCIWLFRSRSRLLTGGLGLIIGGALGNIIDRVVYGAVIDFLDFHIGHYHWPAFNIADTAIFCGAAVVILDNLVTGRSVKKRIA